MRHRKFLAELEQKKTAERETAMIDEHVAAHKEAKFREQAAKQRDKIKGLKSAEVEVPQEQMSYGKPSALTAENLSQVGSRAPPSQSSKKPKKSAKPAWAMTEKMTEDAKEAEIDNLLEFAYELDYEKYMEDFEVREALAVIQNRVNEIVKDGDWKEKMADEWNRADEIEKQQRHEVRSQAPSQASKYSQT